MSCERPNNRTNTQRQEQRWPLSIEFELSVKPWSGNPTGLHELQQYLLQQYIESRNPKLELDLWIGLLMVLFQVGHFENEQDQSSVCAVYNKCWDFVEYRVRFRLASRNGMSLRQNPASAHISRTNSRKYSRVRGF